jgi:hypothetical protein
MSTTTPDWLADNTPWLERARARWAPRSAEPLRLRVWLRSAGLAYDPYQGVQLEGALQHLVVLIETGRMPADVFARKPRAVATDIQIPIADVPIEGRPIACASWGMFPVFALESVRWLRKRARHGMLNPPGGRGIIPIAGGAYKSLNIPVARMSSPWVDFHVRGDRTLLASLCPRLTALGRHRSHVEVMAVEIDPDPLDASLWLDDNPQRVIPVPAGTAGARECTTRAPYWAVGSMALCVVPGG